MTILRIAIISTALAAAACNRGTSGPAPTGSNMTTSSDLETELQVMSAKPGDVRVQVVVRNRGSAPVSLPEPVIASAIPAEVGWTWTPESYQTALLLSYNLMTMTVTGPDGAELPSQGLNPWSTHVRPVDRVLRPGDALDLTIVLSDFYELRAGETYGVSIDFGEAGKRVHVEGTVAVAK